MGHTKGATVAITTAAALIGIGVGFGLPFCWLWLTAPVAQRNEARSQMETDRAQYAEWRRAEESRFNATDAQWREEMERVQEQREDLRGQLGDAEKELRELRPKLEAAEAELERLTRPHASRLGIKNLARAAVSSLADWTQELEDPSKALAWLTTTDEWLRASVGEGEARTFFGLAGGTDLVKGYKFGLDASFLWPHFNGTRAREWLEELIARADQVTVVQTFNPDEWKDTYE
jgi:hypothetical protein